jgi:hypothetical protein
VFVVFLSSTLLSEFSPRFLSQPNPSKLRNLNNWHRQISHGQPRIFLNRRFEGAEGSNQAISDQEGHYRDEIERLKQEYAKLKLDIERQKEKTSNSEKILI